MVSLTGFLGLMGPLVIVSSINTLIKLAATLMTVIGTAPHLVMVWTVAMATQLAVGFDRRGSTGCIK